ncbi:MAG: methyltransferase domain-containing protein [Desulfobacteraceae bacterium]|nr:methyltransferase domain-containing protein [Desulfobacteraceae bacterium]
MKTTIERSFNRASLTYDDYADVQLEAARRLKSKLTGRSCERIFEIGCGTGCYTEMLLEVFKDAIIEAIDISPVMIAEARKKFFQNDRLNFSVADGEDLPFFIKGPFDLITANSALHWFQDMEAAFRIFKGLLSSKGTIVFSIFGPLTLRELACILSESFGYDIALPAMSFPDYQKIKDLLLSIFKRVYMDELLICREYDNLFSLFRSLKGTGVSLSIQPTHPLRLTPARIYRMDHLYRRCFGAVRASYQVFLCEAN